MKSKILVSALVFLLLVAAFAQADDYRIRPGDTLSVTVLEEPDLTRSVTVDPQGSISLPLVNDMKVAGLTLQQATAQIVSGLRKFMKYPQVNVALTQAAGTRVTVSGDVKTPGVYSVSAGSRLMDAITMAGGYNPTANLSGVIISKGSGASVTVDLNNFLLRSDISGNPAVEAGDTIFVPGSQTDIAGTVSVLGAVKQSGQHQIVHGMTVRETIMLAGGPTEFADLNNVTLRRSGGSESIPVNYNAAAAGSPEANLVLQSGDVIYVGIQQGFGFFTVNGAVNNPGRYELKGNTNLTEAVATAGGPKDRARLSSVRVLRSQNGQTQTLRANMSDIYRGKAQNIPIGNGDSIWIETGRQRPDMLRIISLGLSLGWLLTRN